MGDGQVADHGAGAAAGRGIGREQRREAIVTRVEKITTIAGKPVFNDSTATLDADLQKMVEGLVEAGVDAQLLEAEAHKGSTAHKFVEMAKDADADLIVLGSHGKGSLAGVFLGGFAHDLLKIAPCPVLVVPWTHPDI